MESGFSDFVRLTESQVGLNTEAPVFGNMKAGSIVEKQLKNIKVRYLIAHMDDPFQAMEAQEIFTRALQCQHMLNKPGDIHIFAEETNFNKHGEYTVVIKYGELLAEEDEQDNTSEPITQEVEID